VNRILITNPRSGTHYLKALIARVLGHPPVEKAFADAEELRCTVSSTRAEQLIYGHFYHSRFRSVLDPRRLGDMRMLVLTRHPIDRLISQLALTRAQGGRLPNRTATPQQLARELLLGHWDGKPWEDGYVVEDYAATHNFYLRELVTDWLEFRTCRMVAFEPLVARPVEVLAECLDFLQVPASSRSIEDATQSIRFETLSNGRKPGQVDALSHYRRGIPGEWRSVFSADDIRLLRPKYAEAFASAGYVL
jgi:hypothetical protein